MISFLNDTAIFQVFARFFVKNSDSIANTPLPITESIPYSVSTTLTDYFDEIVNNVTVFYSKLDDLPIIERASGEAIGFWQSVVIGTLLLVLILFCVIGNCFVILAILVERDLRSRPQYYLIFSLAVADLLVGLIVTPLGAWAALWQAWNLGVTLCDFWISVDVLVCTSSILHLVAIALDRYWSVTDIYYVQNRTPKRIFFMLMIIWVVSLLISLAPIFGWKDEQFMTRVRVHHVCLISQQISYQVFSTATAFYIPLCAIIIVYYKIMHAAKKRFRRERNRRIVNQASDDANTMLKTGVGCKSSKSAQFKKIVLLLLPSKVLHKKSSIKNSHSCIENSNFQVQHESTNVNTSTSDDDEQTLMQISSTPTTKPTTLCCTIDEKTNNSNGNHVNNNCCLQNFEFKKNNLTLSIPAQQTQSETKFANKIYSNEKTFFGKRLLQPVTTSALIKRKKLRSVKESVEMRRERKAWRTLAIITGTFVACWTPFFLVSLYRPICACRVPPAVENVTNWLGYLNSALNPIIYTVFSTDFRMAFQRILKRMCLIKDFNLK